MSIRLLLNKYHIKYPLNEIKLRITIFHVICKSSSKCKILSKSLKFLSRSPITGVQQEYCHVRQDFDNFLSIFIHYRHHLSCPNRKLCLPNHLSFDQTLVFLRPSLLHPCYLNYCLATAAAAVFIVKVPLHFVIIAHHNFFAMQFVSDR